MAQQNRNSAERLVGWLVSYGLDEKGFSYEIRSGRTLITSGALDTSSELQVEDRTVSAPHAALRANTKHKIMVLDIFSTNGTYLVKLGTDKEVPVTGPSKLEHGDWLRLGGTRFQVCLIDGPR
jgi:pSer/pThr/pTyr-binding forkhead associated (FHA) protein